MKQILEKKEVKNTLNERKLGLMPKIGIIVMTMVLCTVPAFAGVENFGQNIGNWGVEQISALAVCVIAGVLLKYLTKKAWVAAIVFIVVGAIMYSIISGPEILESVGSTLLGIITQ